MALGPFATKASAFLLLFAMQSGTALLFKLSQRSGRYTYSTGSAQTIAEAIKLVMSVCFFWRETTGALSSSTRRPVLRAA